MGGPWVWIGHGASDYWLTGEPLHDERVREQAEVVVHGSTERLARVDYDCVLNERGVVVEVPVLVVGGDDASGVVCGVVDEVGVKGPLATCLMYP